MFYAQSASEAIFRARTYNCITYQGRIQDLWKGGGGAAATTSAVGAKVFGGSRLKTLFGISKGGARAPCAPPLNPLVLIQSVDDDYLMNETRRKPTIGRQSSSLFDKWHRICYKYTVIGLYIMMTGRGCM